MRGRVCAVVNAIVPNANTQTMTSMNRRFSKTFKRKGRKGIRDGTQREPLRPLRNPLRNFAFSFDPFIYIRPQ